jgi:hypothetical protein
MFSEALSISLLVPPPSRARIVPSRNAPPTRNFYAPWKPPQIPGVEPSRHAKYETVVSEQEVEPLTTADELSGLLAVAHAEYLVGSAQVLLHRRL